MSSTAFLDIPLLLVAQRLDTCGPSTPPVLHACIANRLDFSGTCNPSLGERALRQVDGIQAGFLDRLQIQCDRRRPEAKRWASQSNPCITLPCNSLGRSRWSESPHPSRMPKGIQLLRYPKVGPAAFRYFFCNACSEMFAKRP